MPKTDHLQTLTNAVAAARQRGWRVVNKNTVSFTTTHDTPEWISDSQWPSKTYTRVTFLSFVPKQGTTPAVVLGEARTPWTGRRDRKISFKQALHLLQRADHPS